MPVAYLESLLELVGVAIAVVASFLAVPHATHLLWQRFVRRIVGFWRGAGSAVAEIIGGFRPAPAKPVNLKVSISDVGMAGDAVVTAKDRGTAPTRDIGRRMEEAEAEIVRLIASLDDLRAEMMVVLTDQVMGVRTELQVVEGRLEALRAKQHADKEADLRVDAGAVPVVGVGALLSGLHEQLAKNPTIAMAALVAALLLLQFAFVRFVQVSENDGNRVVLVNHNRVT